MASASIPITIASQISALNSAALFVSFMLILLLVIPPGPRTNLPTVAFSRCLLLLVLACYSHFVPVKTRVECLIH
jgi:flagellar biosynthesis component FlhA